MKQFVTVAGTIGWEADAQGLKITLRHRTLTLRWSDISAAGLVRFSGPDIPEDMPVNILPGLGKLVDLDERLAQEQKQLVLARGRSLSRAVRIPIPLQEPEAMALVNEVRSNLGVKWIGEVPLQDHQAALGLSTPWWFYLLFGFGFVAFGVAILLAIGAFQALSSGNLAGVPPLAWVALLLWVILVGGLFVLYRRRR